MEPIGLRYPIGMQDFAGIREDGWVYVDKTADVYRLTQKGRYVFLSRPRRFGKSLLLSTIRYYFEGRKDLFEGLQIMELEKEWISYPVLHLSLSSIDSNDPNGLNELLAGYFRRWEEKLGLTNKSLSFSERFKDIIIGAKEKTGRRVVILIDEYDNPLINTINKKDIHEAFRTLLKSIYSNLKDMDEYIRFAMITGVSRFSNTTIFSGLNNLQDITFDDEFDSICGFTENELKQFLWPGVREFAREEGLSDSEALNLLKREYDGYHFSKRLVDIYNPFSLLNCLSKKDIQNYWMMTGVPEFLARKLGENDISFKRLFSAEASSKDLSVVDAAFDDPIALFYQTGYLTIKNYIREDRLYKLGIPNKEINEGLFHFLLGKYTPTSSREAGIDIKEMARCLREGKADEFLERLQSLLAPISYHLQGKMTETDFERTMFVIFHVLGFHVHSEMATSRGRIDLTVETQDYVYIMELKLNGSAEEALRQIDSKEYALQWKFDVRKVFKIGINFNSGTRNIEIWVID